MEESLKKSVTRRDFLKRSGKAALAFGGALTLEKLLFSCTPALKETIQDVDRIEWECNPIIPIPDGKCYTGTNAQIPIDVYKGWWEENLGISPTFNTPCSGQYDALNDMFPKKKCEAEVRNGVIPVVRYAVRYSHFDGFKHITEGKFDEDVKKFAHQVAKFEHPMVLLPFEQPNSMEHKRWIHSGYPGKEYIEAWVHMHELFEREGANRNTVWSTKLKFGSWSCFQVPDPFQYIPPKDHVDIIGWQANNLNKPELGFYSQSLRSLFDSYYTRAATKYPTKPQMFWEFSSNQDRWQHRWLDKALTDIENRYARIKGVMLDEFDMLAMMFHHNFGDYIATLTPESVKVVRKHFTSGYYIGSILDKSSKIGS